MSQQHFVQTYDTEFDLNRPHSPDDVTCERTQMSATLK